MMKIKYSKEFKRNFKHLRKRNVKNLDTRFQEILSDILSLKTLNTKYKDHALIGNWKGYRECHIFPDLIMIYKTTDEYLLLATIGTHSDIFK